MKKSSLFVLTLFALSVLAFWFVEKTTAYRISSLVFFVLVGLYGVVLRRIDVFAASTLFFSVYSVNQYFFDNFLPPWITVAISVVLIFILWTICFYNGNWLTPIVVALLVAELMIVAQYTVVDVRWQVFFVVLPFVYAAQTALAESREADGTSI